MLAKVVRYIRTFLTISALIGLLSCSSAYFYSEGGEYAKQKYERALKRAEESGH